MSRCSGSGKTTLLNALAARTDSRTMTVTGDIKVNGVAFGSGIQNISGYVQQDELFIASMTVREHLVFRVRHFSAICHLCIVIFDIVRIAHFKMA